MICDKEKLQKGHTDLEIAFLYSLPVISNCREIENYVLKITLNVFAHSLGLRGVHSQTNE